MPLLDSSAWLIEAGCAALVGLGLLAVVWRRHAQRRAAQRTAIATLMAQVDRLAKSRAALAVPAAVNVPAVANASPSEAGANEAGADTEDTPIAVGESVDTLSQWHETRTRLDGEISQLPDDPLRAIISSILKELDAIAQGLPAKAQATADPSTTAEALTPVAASDASPHPMVELIEALAPYVTDDQAQSVLTAARAAAAQLSAMPLTSDSNDSDARDKAMKQMISQFARDSRDMLACIRRLEAENAALLQGSGAQGQQAA